MKKYRDLEKVTVISEASQVAQWLKNPPAKVGNARDTDFIPESGRSPGAGHGNLLQYSCTENPKDRGAWWATVHGTSVESKELDMTEATQHTRMPET